jgi:superoxide dismutase, Fe-Mn family
MFTLMALPYADNALAPVISANTIGFHYGKHHKTYVDNLNNLVKGTDLEGKGLEEIVMATAGKADKAPLFNNSAQIWNHDFYWKSLKPNGGGVPTGKVADRINESFGSFDEFKKQLSATTVGQFGSGWGWLVADAAGKLKVVKTGNAEVPMTQGLNADHRRLGARLLPRPPEPPRGLRERGDRQAAQLGIRGSQPRLAGAPLQ